MYKNVGVVAKLCHGIPLCQKKKRIEILSLPASLKIGKLKKFTVVYLQANADGTFCLMCLPADLRPYFMQSEKKKLLIIIHGPKYIVFGIWVTV